jgi:hypothetical protein
VILAAAVAGCTPEGSVAPADAPVAVVTLASQPPFVFPDGCCYYEDRMVRTVVPPARSPNQGRDNFYAFPSGAAAGQKGVVGVAPGDTEYHGGQWAFHAVSWNVTPYLLTSEAAVLAAEAGGDVTVTRIAANDFKCPIQP